MNADAVNAIAELAQKAADPIVNTPEHSTYLVRQPNGALESRVIFKKPAALVLGDLTSLLRVAQAREAKAILVHPQRVTVIQHNGFTDGEVAEIVEAEDLVSAPEGDEHPEPLMLDAPLLLSPLPVDALLSDSSTYSVSHTLDLTKHPAFELLERWSKTVDLGQKDLIRTLRTVLADFVAPEDVQKFRTVSYSKSTEGNRDVRSGAESFGRRIVEEAKVANGQDVPESFAVQVPVYDLAEVAEFLQTVTVIVEVSPNDGNPIFTLTARHNDLKRAQDAALREIEARCEAEFPLVLRGTTAR